MGNSGVTEGSHESNAGSVSGNLISARGLSKGFDTSGARLEILSGLDLDLDAGETLAVVGASGIGKSTLLHILGTLDRPDKGTMLYRGEDVFRFDDTRLAKFRNETIGFVFQFHHLLPEFNAVENAMMPALIKGWRKQDAWEAAEAILIRVGLENRLTHRVDKLSGGEQQRVALARALILKPTVLLADEPTGNLDKQNHEQVLNLLLELNSELGMALVVVTHNMDLASTMSRRVTIVDKKLMETS